MTRGVLKQPVQTLLKGVTRCVMDSDLGLIT